MPREIQIVCMVCKELVPVIDKVIQEHGDCPVGGMRYVPSPVVIKGAPGAPSIEVVATKEFGGECPDCGTEHPLGVAALLRVNVAKPLMN